MIQLIVGIFKYSVLVIVILVLSHVVQIKGVTVSRHVENAMNWISGANPARDFNQSMGDIRDGMKHRTEVLNQAAEFSTEDQKQLNQVIQKSQKQQKKK
jgi:hypothetical protein